MKAFKRQKYQCVNLAGRAFSAYLDDIPARMIWDDGRTAEVFKEDKLYTELNEITMPGVEYIDALLIQAGDVYCFYGNGIQVDDANYEYERLRVEQEVFKETKTVKLFGQTEKKSLSFNSPLQLLGKVKEEEDEQ